jgi:hypothetical protein
MSNSNCLHIIDNPEHDCSYLYTCCDCGGHDCGCHQCFSCNACENCLEEDD